ncbi:MAG: ammonium transporter [Polyangia bacterium]
MTNEQIKIAADTGWTLLTGFLVFFMNAGFGLIEAGLCQRKNTTMILSKNFVVFAIATLGFYILGFGLMFSDGGWLGTAGGWLLGGADNSPASGEAYQGIFGSLGWAGVPLPAKFFFEAVFAGTSATIVSGSVNERMKYASFLVFSLVLTGLIYPIAGHWIWGGGFLARAGMRDFSGSTVVHSVGGWAALAGIIVLGPRLGRYPEGAPAVNVPGHHMGYVFLGGMILWLGWFGFNPGSTLSLDPEAISRIAVTTVLASCASTVVATLHVWWRHGRPDFPSTVNGCLAGLVSITAPCAYVSPTSALLIGIVAGVMVSEAPRLFDRLHLDDPVGATSVHLVHGIFGTLCVGLFGIKGQSGLPHDGFFRGGGFGQLAPQFEAVVTVGAFSFFTSLLVWTMIDKAYGLRVSPDHERIGLDRAEMGMEAYPPGGALDSTGEPALPSVVATEPTTFG